MGVKSQDRESRKILVTGGAGYIGSHTCKALSNAGFLPVVFDNLSTGHMGFVKWGPFEQGDIRDNNALVRVIKKHSPSAVIHFAASAYVGESVDDPGKYYDNNVCGSLALLLAMAETGIDKIVFSSSCATYGQPASLPIVETSQQQPINPYGWTKLFVEQMLKDFEQANGLRSIVLRYFNAAGADADFQIGERHDPETHLIPLALRAVAGDTLQIFGNQFDTEDGTCIRDFIHVTDLAEAHVKALKLLHMQSLSCALNLGTGHGHSILAIIRTVELVTGKKADIKFCPPRIGDPPALVSNSDKAQKVLEWQPQNSSLENIVRTAWRWHQIDCEPRQ